MPSPMSDQSSDGGISLTPRMTFDFKKPVDDLNGNPFPNTLIPYIPAPVPTNQSLTTPMAMLFNDIRASCLLAQSRIMRLQQATNTQVGITSTVRQGWFEELRLVAQCFISAQQATAKMEQAVNTERAQLQGALSAALNERDAARQKVKVLNTKLDELTIKIQKQASGQTLGVYSHPNSGQNTHSVLWRNGTFDKPTVETQTNSESWILQEDSSDNTSPDNCSIDFLSQLPKKMEDMPFSPELKRASLSRKNGFGFHDSETVDKTSFDEQFKPTVPRTSSQGYPRNDQSKFFGKDFGAVTQQQKYNCSAGGKTPEFGGRNTSRHNGSAIGGRFSSTPGFVSQGPFAPPAQQQSRPRPGTDFRDRQGAQPPTPSIGPPPQTQSHQGLLHLNSTSSVQRPMRVLPPPAPTPALAPAPAPVHAPSTELALIGDKHNVFGEFAPGVVPARGPDEERVRDIFQFFNDTMAWVVTNCNSPDKRILSDMKQYFPRLWDYACSATYPTNPSNAESHAKFMLSNDECRAYFTTRLIIQFVVQQIWSPQAWEGLDEKLTETLVNIKQRLDPKYGYDAVLQPHERHALVEKRSRAIYEFMRQPTWAKVKSQKISAAVTRFKDIVSPMMNKGIDRQGATHELSGLAETALRLSAILNTSRLSFQFIFNECGIKFSDQSHRALKTAIPARELQTHHWRLMCVVTPGITYRNDAGVSVDPRFLAKANVLVMQ